MILNSKKLEADIVQELNNKAGFIKYRISKYSPTDRDSQGRYLKEEWTSYCDIGKSFKNRNFTKEEYIRTEIKYCEVVLRVLEELKVHKLHIEKLEKCYSLTQLKSMLEGVDLKLSAKDEWILNNLDNMNEVNDSEVENYLRLLLRECFWCELKSDSLMITTGYDFYVYMFSSIPISDKIVEESSEKGIYVEKMTR